MKDTIEKFKLLANYDLKLTLKENHELIIENSGLAKLLKRAVISQGKKFYVPQDWVETALRGIKLVDGSTPSPNQLIRLISTDALTPTDLKNVYVALFKSPGATEPVKNAIVDGLSLGISRPTTPFTDKKSAIKYIKSKISDDDLVNRMWEKVKGDITFYKKEIKNINWNNIPQISDDTAKKLFITNRTLWDKVKNFITPSKAILNGKVEKIKLLSKRYTETNDTNLKSDIQDELKKELYSLGIESKKMMKSTNQFLNEVISKFKRDSRGNIINPGEKMFSEYIGKIQSDTEDFTNIGKLLQFTPEGNQFLMVLKDAFNSAIKPAKVIQSIRNRGKSAREITLQMFGKETENISDEMLKKIEQNHKSAINWFKTGSPRGNPWYPKYQQNYEDIISKSGLSAAKKSYLMELVIRLIKFKIIWGSLYIIRDYLTYYVKRMDDKTEELLNKCLLDKKNKVKDSQYCSKLTSTHFGEWMLTVATVLQEKAGWEAFADIALKEYLPIIEGSFGDEITDWWPGYYDDLGTFIFNSVKFIFNKENIDKSLDDVDELMRERQDEIDNVQTQIDTTLSQNNVNLSPPTPVNTDNQYTNDLPSFKEYMKKVMGDTYNESLVGGTKDTFTYDGETLTFDKGKFVE
jgi:hypothetical protein